MGTVLLGLIVIYIFWDINSTMERMHPSFKNKRKETTHD